MLCKCLQRKNTYVWEKNKEKELLKNPRSHHYYFAHIFLRRACEYNPLKFFETMESDKKDDLIKFVWDKVCEQFDQEQKIELTADLNAIEAII